jgi:hypothetical protein
MPEMVIDFLGENNYVVNVSLATLTIGVCNVGLGKSLEPKR